MKAILKRPIEGLKVGQTYDVSFSETFERGNIELWHDGGMYKIYDYWMDDFLDDWFVLQELPETIKDYHQS